MMDPVRTPQGQVFERSRLAEALALGGSPGGEAPRRRRVEGVETSPRGSSCDMAGRKAPARGKRSAVPRDEALQRLQEAFNVLKQTKQGAGRASQTSKFTQKHSKAMTIDENTKAVAFGSLGRLLRSRLGGLRPCRGGG